MTIGIVGSRRRCSLRDYILLHDKFDAIYNDGDEIVSGGCLKGADNFAETIARELQVPIMIRYARWNKFRKAAGMIRNTDIAKDADVLIALPAIDRTGGTEDTIAKFKLFHPGQELHIINYGEKTAQATSKE